MISPRTLLTTGQLVLLGVAAFLSASTVNALVASRCRSHPTASVTPPAQAPPVTKHPLAYYQPITAKDVFNPPRAEPEPQAQVSQLQAKLLGTAPPRNQPPPRVSPPNPRQGRMQPAARAARAASAGLAVASQAARNRPRRRH